MASTINATSTGSGGLISTGDASGQLELQTNGTTSLAINSAGALGLGSSPSYGTSGQVLTSSGSSAAPTWAAAGANIVRSARTSNTILGTADKGNLIAITSGTFTQTFTAAATLGSGWFCYIQNSGTGNITLDPDGSETIDGLTSYIMYPNEVRLVQCDGSNFFTVVIDPFYVTFTATGTFTKPPGYALFAGLLWGAGGGGGKSTIDAWAGGGGGGAAVPFLLASSAVGTTETITIGAGGTGSSSSGNGTAGGNSTFGSLVTSYGGGGGGGNGCGNRPGGGGGGGLGVGETPSDCLGAQGGSPFTGCAYNTGNRTLSQNFGGGGTQGSRGGASAYGGGGGGSANGNGGKSIYGGGGGGGTNGNTAIAANNAGTSVFGGSGGNAVRASSGSDGTAPGGGGGATQSGTKGGDGARGEARIWGIT
jgi:hypothetical protein